MTEQHAEQDGRAVRRLRVLEFAQGYAGPACGRLYAGLGHEVIKIEPPGGDYLRGSTAATPADAELMASGFRVLNAGKASVVLDLRSRDGVLAAGDLIRTADLVISDLAPETMTALDLLGPGRQPGVVVVALSTFGLDCDEPWVRPDSLLAESFGGLAAMIGDPARSPLSLGGEQAAYSAGFAAFLGAQMALREPDGDVVDVALADVAAYEDWKSEVTWAISGTAPRRTGVSSGRWRMVPAADGWVGIVYQPEQWAAMVALIDDPRLADPRLRDDAGREKYASAWWPAVRDWAAPQSRREIFERAQRLGLAFGMGLSIGEVAGAEQLLARGFIPPGQRGGVPDPLGPFFTSADLPWVTGPVPELGSDDGRLLGARHEASARGRTPADLAEASPLAGMVVLDLGTITAGAATGRLLADYGATVIKIEAPDHPDSFRTWTVTGVDPAAQPGVSPAFESNNAGKLGAAIDLKSPTGRTAFSGLLERADVVIENFRVGVTRRLGIDYESIAPAHPRVVYLSLSSQGQFGPESGYRSYGSTLDMLSGLAGVTGYGDGVPNWSSADVNYPDQVVSLLGAGLVSYAWCQGVGAHIDMSQRETISWTLADHIDLYRRTGIEFGASGNHRPGADPHDVYECAAPESWVAIACFDDSQRRALAELLGTDAADLDQATRAWCRQLARSEAVSALRAVGIPCAPVLDAAERGRHPHFNQRRVFLAGASPRKGFPLLLQGYRPPDPTPAPALGEHNDLIAARIARLTEPHRTKESA